MQQLICLMGFIAILQMVFLPGFLALRAFSLDLPVIRLSLLSFALSFLINSILVCFLTALHMYTSSVMWSIVALELIALIYLLSFKKPAWESFFKQIHIFQEFWQSLNRGGSSDRFVRQGLFFLSLFIVLFFAENFIDQLGQIFTAWDPVMSYNFWAQDWAADQFPRYTWHYPQLIPISWSISYVLTAPASLGVNIEFFAKAVMPLFPLMLVLIFFDLALETKRCSYLFAIALSTYLLFHFASDFGQGWVDLPMTFFAFLALSLLYLAGASGKKSYIFLASLSFAASALSKQAGLYLLIWYPLLCYALAFQSPKKISPILLSWILALSISLPWYVYIQYQIDHGLVSSEIGFVTSNIYQVLNLNWMDRILLGLFQPGLVFWISFGLAIFYARYRSPWKMLLLPIVAYTLIWVFFYSYALRNFTLMVPLVSLMASFGLEKLYIDGFFQRIAKKTINYFNLHSLKPLHVLIALLIAIFVLTQIPQCSSLNLVESQISKQRLLGDPDLNWMLYRYEAKQGFSGKIMTSWDYLEYVPGLSQYYQPYRPQDVEANPYQSSWMVDPTQLPGILKRYPAKYILVAKGWGLTSKAYLRYFKQLEQKGVLKAVVILPDFTLYEIEQSI